MTSVTAQPERSVARVRVASAAAAGGLFAACVLAAVLRFYAFGRVYTTPYYDAAVRSMGLSWHNFLYGALEPSGQVSIDKPPVDLWLQVASTKLFGFSSVSLRLPPAIAGTLAVPLLYDLVRRGYGHWAGLASALALAVLPASVLTSRSDTMDAVMSALLIGAAWLVVRTRPERRAVAVVGAGAIAGLAFEVKLFEAAVALPALALLAWLALDGGAARRARVLVAAAAAYVATAASWAVVATLLPGRHPWPLGSTDGQVWNAILVYNGLDRFGHPPTSATAPGLLRLFQSGPPRDFGALIGVELSVALLFGALAAPLALRAGAAACDRARRRVALGWGLGAWLVIGTLVASFMGRQWPRYLEAFTPAVAAVLGIGLVSIARAAERRTAAVLALAGCATAAAFCGLIAGGKGQPAVAVAAGHPGAGDGRGTALAVAVAAGLTGLVLALWAADARAPARRALVAAAAAATLVAALAVPLSTSMRLVRDGAGDSAAAGGMPAAKLDPLSAYLRAHQRGARYEVAGASILKATALII